MSSDTCSEEVIDREVVNRKYGETTLKNRKRVQSELPNKRRR